MGDLIFSPVKSGSGQLRSGIGPELRAREVIEKEEELEEEGEREEGEAEIVFANFQCWMTDAYVMGCTLFFRLTCLCLCLC